jgi:hypothetical protein
LYKLSFDYLKTAVTFGKFAIGVGNFCRKAQFSLQSRKVPDTNCKLSEQTANQSTNVATEYCKFVVKGTPSLTVKHCCIVSVFIQNLQQLDVEDDLQFVSYVS